jgi:DNA topoisomerase-1
MQDLPGEELFQYVDDHGGAHAIESADVNAYLKSIAGDEFTSKDFRTWAGTLLCARALRRLPPPSSVGGAKREVAQAIETVAGELRNTRAVCRKCYVHPGVIDGYLEGRLQDALRGRPEREGLISLLQGVRRRRLAERPLPELLARSRFQPGASHA